MMRAPKEMRNTDQRKKPKFEMKNNERVCVYIEIRDGTCRWCENSFNLSHEPLDVLVEKSIFSSPFYIPWKSFFLIKK